MASKKYIFLTNTMGGITGGPSYVKNKCEWLGANGWDVSVFDNYGSKFAKIVYPTFFPFKKNRMNVLWYDPMMFSERYRNKVFDKIVKLSHLQGDYIVVVESNTKNLAKWGELFSRYINAKHIIYDFGENEFVEDRQSFDFFYYKYLRNELFFICKQAVDTFFQKYIELDDSENHYWSARSTINAVDTKKSPFDYIPDDKIVITYFGRKKEYFPYVFQEIMLFANSINNLPILFLIVGDGFNKRRILKKIKKPMNLRIAFKDSLFPVPQKLFDKSDLVIASAGCARIAFLAGAKTITMDIEHNVPLGLLGYTTKETVYRNSNELYVDSLQKILMDVFVYKKYPVKPIFNPYQEQGHGYDYQMMSINDDKQYWPGKFEYHKYSEFIKWFFVDFIVGRMHFIRLGTTIRYLKSKF